MQCTRPIYASITRLSDGSNSVKLLPKRVDQYSRERLEELYGHDHIIPLPCGKCLACKINYARNWAARCVLEASMHKENWFLTLTYDDAHYKDIDFSNTKKEMSDFMKRLRNELGDGIKFFGCGEFGSNTKRFHMHLILFNCEIPDVKCLGKAPSGYYFSSDLINKIWEKGHTLLGEVTYSSCNYVARYCVKKVYGEDHPGEFVHMSRRPGIGYSFFLENYQKIYKDDRIYFNFGNSLYQSPSRFFDKLYMSIDPVHFQEVKDKRISNADVSLASELVARGCKHKEDLYKVQENLNSKVKKRGF